MIVDAFLDLCLYILTTLYSNNKLKNINVIICSLPILWYGGCIHFYFLGFVPLFLLADLYIKADHTSADFQINICTKTFSTFNDLNRVA